MKDTDMKTTCNKVDRSVKWTNIEPASSPAKQSNWIPLVPITTAEEMKSNLVKSLVAEYSCVAPRLVFQAVNEAYALAALTGEPLLVLPVLAEEKVQNAATWTAQQRAILNGTPLAVAA
jgi:hypothetical protein